ncbi:MAG: YegS/Rv2252/BmrU family lipid kinase [Oscillospiraceae bacterium]|nr:YegS/Rv2252/BmrU family lipid kinase [Oscillospiraceae bacterium]MBR5260708.1 YegS/Rv2252/BmrU family lipid kinase [Oscillospiraceae bacterium]
MKHLFIVNPIAGGKDRTEYVSAKVAQTFSNREGEFEIYTTKAPLDAVSKIMTESLKCNELRVYACGGDGTLNECVNAAIDLDNVTVTCFPNGTGNDFIKHFGEDRERFFKLEELVDGEVHPIDVIKCNERYSINICSVGIDARIGLDVHKYSHLPVVGGSAGYVISTAVHFFKGIKEHLRVLCNGRLFSGDMTLICACNGSYYGGGFHPVPDARPDDGLLDFLIIKGVSRATFAKLVGEYAKGNYAKYPKYITHIRSTKMEISADNEIVINVDGERAEASKINIQVIPKAVNFVFPKNMRYFAEHQAEEATV